MDSHLEHMLGPLRGHEAPSAAILQRLYDISEAYRVSWTPPSYRRPMALFWIHEVRPPTKVEIMRRKAAEGQLTRIREHWAIERRVQQSALEYQLEGIVRGFHDLGSWPEYGGTFTIGKQRHKMHGFGSEPMLLELAKGEAAARQWRAKIDRDYQEEALDQVALETHEDPDFRDYVRQMAKDWYPQITSRPIVPKDIDGLVARLGPEPAPILPRGTVVNAAGEVIAGPSLTQGKPQRKVVAA